MSERITVFVADDQSIVRNGVLALLATKADIHVVGEATNGHEAVAGVLHLRPDVILMDLVMPEMDGIDAIQAITAQWPAARILVLTSFATDDKVFPAIKAGALGYLLKDSTPQDLLDAIRQVRRGEVSLHPTIARKVLRELSQPAAQQQAVDALTERELEVLKLIARGLSNDEMATHLIISEATVRNHVSNILSKLHLANRTQAALYALRKGLAALAEDEEFVA
jgi:NarL family two-component system response regulator LiaR